MSGHPEKPLRPIARDIYPLVLNVAKELRAPLALLLLLLLSTHVHAQGMGAMQTTPPAVSAAYRHAIYLLGGTGASLFILATLLFRRNR